MSISISSSILLIDGLNNSDRSSENNKVTGSSNIVSNEHIISKNSVLLTNSTPDVLCSPVCDGPW